MRWGRVSRTGATLLLPLSLALALTSCGQTSMTILEAIPPGQAAPAQPVVLPVAPICLGVPLEQCRDMASTFFEPLALGDHAADQVTRITVRCKGVCTPKNGEGETRVDFADGTNLISSWGYSSS
jgi:hypothetical protein